MEAILNAASKYPISRDKTSSVLACFSVKNSWNRTSEFFLSYLLQLGYTALDGLIDYLWTPRSNPAEALFFTDNPHELTYGQHLSLRCCMCSLNLGWSANMILIHQCRIKYLLSSDCSTLVSSRLPPAAGQCFILTLSHLGVACSFLSTLSNNRLVGFKFQVKINNSRLLRIRRALSVTRYLSHSVNLHFTWF